MGLTHPGPCRWLFPSLWSSGLWKNWKCIQDLGAARGENLLGICSSGFSRAWRSFPTWSNLQGLTADFSLKPGSPCAHHHHQVSDLSISQTFLVSQGCRAPMEELNFTKPRRSELSASFSTEVVPYSLQVILSLYFLPCLAYTKSEINKLIKGVVHCCIFPRQGECP